MTDEEVVALFNGGLSGTAIARRLGCSNSTIYRVLGRNGISAIEGRRRRHWDSAANARGEEIVAMYRGGMTMGSIANVIGCNRLTVRNVLNRRGQAARRGGPAGRVLTAQEKQRIVALRLDGWTKQDIATELGVSSMRLPAVLDEFGLPQHKRSEVSDRLVRNGGYVCVNIDLDSPFASMGFAPGARRDRCYVLEHRLVMAQHLGRPLRRTEQVHHINGDRADNRLENLELRHGPHGSGVKLQCAACGCRNLIPVPLAS